MADLKIINPKVVGKLKLPAETASKVLQISAAGELEAATASTTELGHLVGVTSAIQTQLGDKAPIASPTFTGTVSGVTAAMVGAPSGSGTSSGANTGDITLAAVGSTPNANGASLTGQALNLQPADGTNPGIITTGAQTIAGAKTFSSAIVANLTGNASGSAATITGNLSGDVTSTGMTTAIADTVVTGKVLTGYSSGAGVVAATDTILQAINKLNGNIGAVATAPTGDIQLTTFAAADNVAAAANVTGLAFAAGTVRSFYAQVSVALNATTPLNEVFEFTGIQLASGFVMAQTSVGDTSGLVFSITSAGQIQYTSPLSAGFVANKISFRAEVTQV